MSNNSEHKCDSYKKLTELTRSLQYEYNIGPGNKYNDLVFQHKHIEILRIENINLLIEKHCRI